MYKTFESDNYCAAISKNETVLYVKVKRFNKIDCFQKYVKSKLKYVGSVGSRYKCSVYSIMAQINTFIFLVSFRRVCKGAATFSVG